jgi:hypothetical protein
VFFLQAVKTEVCLGRGYVILFDVDLDLDGIEPLTCVLPPGVLPSTGYRYSSQGPAVCGWIGMAELFVPRTGNCVPVMAEFRMGQQGAWSGRMASRRLVTDSPML